MLIKQLFKPYPQPANLIAVPAFPVIVFTDEEIVVREMGMVESSVHSRGYVSKYSCGLVHRWKGFVSPDVAIELIPWRVK